MGERPCGFATYYVDEHHVGFAANYVGERHASFAAEYKGEHLVKYKDERPTGVRHYKTTKQHGCSPP